MSSINLTDYCHIIYDPKVQEHLRNTNTNLHDVVHNPKPSIAEIAARNSIIIRMSHMGHEVQEIAGLFNVKEDYVTAVLWENK